MTLHMLYNAKEFCKKSKNSVRKIFRNIDFYDKGKGIPKRFQRVHIQVNPNN